MKQTLILSVRPLQQSEVKNLKFVDYHICDENLPNFKDKFKQYQRLLNFACPFPVHYQSLNRLASLGLIKGWGPPPTHH